MPADPLAPTVNTSVSTRSTSWDQIVTKADPLWRREAHDAVEFEFNRRTFRHDPDTRGAYADD